MGDVVRLHKHRQAKQRRDAAQLALEQGYGDDDQCLYDRRVDIVDHWGPARLYRCPDCDGLGFPYGHELIDCDKCRGTGGLTLSEVTDG